MKKALLLEGGGAKGAYQAGAIKALCKKGIYFDGVGGTSIGAINAAFYVVRKLDNLYKLWLSYDSDFLLGLNSDMLDHVANKTLSREDLKNGMSDLIKIIKNRGVDTTNIKKALAKSINEDRFMRSRIDYGMNTFSLSDFKPVHIFKKDIPKGKLIEYILSSAYLPGFKQERIINGKYYLDGGVYENCPIDMFIDAGYDEIYVVRNWQNKLKYKKKRGVKVHIVTPREDLGSIMRFTKEAAIYRMNLGYYDMLKYLDNLDGYKYYFKYYSEKYYEELFDKIQLKKIIKKYNNGRPIKNYKAFILKHIEKICSEFKIERFKIYNMPYLLTRIKYKMVPLTSNYYYDFVKLIRVDFE